PLAAIVLVLVAGPVSAIVLYGPIARAGRGSAGLVFLAVGGWALADPGGYAGIWPAGVSKDGFDLSRPGYALAAMLAIPLLCTALSARRWEGYQPPKIPIFGTLGRARGAAAAPGTPVAAERTAVITPADPTEIIPVSQTPPPATGAPVAVPSPGIADPAPADSSAHEDEPTLAPTGDEPTAVVVPAADADDQPTAADENADETTLVPTGDEPTAVVVPAADADDQPTAAVTAAEEDADETTPASSADEPTVVVVPAAEADDQPTAVVASAGEKADETTPARTDEEPTVVVPSAGVQDQPTADVPRSGAADSELADAGEPEAQRTAEPVVEQEKSEPTVLVAVDSTGEATTTAFSAEDPQATSDDAETGEEATAGVP
ncbi:hypothetical protein AB0M20_45010, partial [Actinoplanes sp. NPDC051633]